MLLCLDVGNSHIFGGVFDGEDIILRFRHDTHLAATSDQIGIFLRAVLRENSIDWKSVNNISIASVVPSIDYSLRAACKKYFNLEPFILKAGVKTGIKIKTANHNETGADLIAGAIAASHYYPNKNIIVVDLGTATTLMAITAEREFLGGAFLAGLRISVNALSDNASKLFPVEIMKPERATGRFTTESMQAGLYYGHLGAIKEIVSKITREVFAKQPPFLVGTGGFSHLFENEKIFDVIFPDLVLHGLRLAWENNIEK